MIKELKGFFCKATASAIFGVVAILYAIDSNEWIFIVIGGTALLGGVLSIAVAVIQLKARRRV